MNKKNILIIFIILLLLTAVFIGFKENKKEEQLRIGVILPLSGPAAIWGDSIKGGIELANNDLKKEGVNIKIFYEDGEGVPAKSVSAFNKLVTVDDIDVVISALSGPTVPLVPLAEKAGIPLVGTGLANQGFAESSDFAYRVYTTNESIASNIVSFIKNKGYKKVGLISRADEYGESLGNIIVSELEESGISVLEEKFLPTDIDYRTQIQKTKNFDSEIVVFTGITPQELTNFARQKNELFSESDFYLGGMQLSIESLRKELAGILEGTYTLIFPDALYNDSFNQAYKESFGVDPIFAATFGYDSLKFTALPITEGVDEEDYQKAMQKIVNTRTEIVGKSGPIKVNENGEINTEIQTAVILEGDIVLVE